MLHFMRQCLFLSLFVFFSWNTAVAAPYVFIEPSIGYRSETIKLTTLASQETQMKASLPVYGLKLGFRSPLGVDLNLAADYSKGKLEFSPSGEKNDFSHQSASVQLGVSALGLMKIYLGYSFLNEFKVEDGAVFSSFKLSGPAYLAGLQFKLLPLVLIGAQYNLNQFKKIEGRAYLLGNSVESYYSKVDAQDYSIYLSVSF